MLFDTGLRIPPNVFAYPLFEQQQKAEHAYILALLYASKKLMEYSSDPVGRRFHHFLTNTHMADFGFVT